MKATRMAALAATILAACGLGASPPPADEARCAESAEEVEPVERDDGDRPTDPDPFPAWGQTEASLRTAELDEATLATLRRR